MAAGGGGRQAAGLRHAVWRERISGVVLLALGVMAALHA